MFDKYILAIGVTALAIASAAASGGVGWRHSKETAFYPGHRHAADGAAIHAPSHSGGTNAEGCHNGSVPYHCH
ncbi:MAG: hypothetical protein KTR21_16950 [Rhodobacteraceae bacterium]|nr:hypothetical protein [Paracoccaceae bacterium]